MKTVPDIPAGEMTSLSPLHIKCRLRSFFTVLGIGLLDLGLALLLVSELPGGNLFLLGPLLILLLAAVWMLFQAWGYWILRIRTGAESIHIRAPRERFGVFFPPAQNFLCRWSEIDSVELPGMDHPKLPGAGMILRMPIVSLVVVARDGRAIRLSYSMLKGQVQEIAALISGEAKSRQRRDGGSGQGRPGSRPR